MTKMKKIALMIVGAFVVFGSVTACGSDNPRGGVIEGPGTQREFSLDLHDGRSLPCVSVGYSQEQMMSCDWGNAK